MKTTNNIISKISKNRLFKYGVAPAFLFILALVLIAFNILTTDISITIISEKFNNLVTTPVTGRELLKGQKAAGSFISHENNLGLLYIKFETFNRLNNDDIAFRIKKHNDPDWYFQSKYDTLQMSYIANNEYPFGFPVINDSKDVQFDFEVESLDGKKGNSVGISSIPPIATAKYKFSKSELLHDRNLAAHFILKKIENAIHYNNLLYNIFTSFIPLIMYLIVLFFPREKFQKLLSESPNQKVSKGMYPIHSIFIICILLDILINPITNDLLMISLVVSWLLVTLYFRHENTLSLKLSLLLICLCPILLFFNKPQLAEKTAVWIYLLMVSSVIYAYLKNMAVKSHE